jgi:DNA-binding transcriptional MerR regulator
MDMKYASRLLSIGEFSAATQLSPKALRLYDEQRLLQPAIVDATTGYRYYRTDQVALGRLVRALRDMELPLSAVAGVICADPTHAQGLLAQYIQQADQRYARLKRASQLALVRMNRAAAPDTSRIEEDERAATTVVVHPFIANRWTLLNHFRAEVFAARALLRGQHMEEKGEPACVLVDPLSEEDTQLEIWTPVATPAAIPSGIAVRRLPAAIRATFAIDSKDGQLPDLTAALDALFDWFDRRGSQVTEPPSISFAGTEAPLRTLVSWACAPVA